MIIKPQHPSGRVIFCDDVRQEISGKVSLMGLYGGELIVYGEPPLHIPMLHIVVFWRDSAKDFTRNVNIKIFKQGKQEEVMFSGDMEISDIPDELNLELPAIEKEHEYVEAMLISRHSPLIITEPCLLRVRGFIGDDVLRLGTLRVRIAPLQEYPGI